VSNPSAALPPPQPTAPPAHSAAPKAVNFVDLRLGDCVIDLPPSDLSTVTVNVVDCTAPHLAEVITRHDIEVNTAVNDVANQACTAGLHTYAGGASSDRLSVTYLIDSNQDRTSDNPLPSTVICLAQSADGSALQGSIRR
jgi:hypothetical protein